MCGGNGSSSTGLPWVQQGSVYMMEQLSIKVSKEDGGVQSRVPVKWCENAFVVLCLN